MQDTLIPSFDFRIVATSSPLRHQVVARIRRAITESEFPSGKRLIERELCEMLGVSRTSLREALRELEIEGLVSNIPNKGVIVTEMTLAGVRETYEIREALEGLIVAKFAVNSTDVQIKLLEQSLCKLEAAYSTSTIDVLAAKNIFYDLLMEGSGHVLASTMLSSIQRRAGALRLTTLSIPSRAKQSATELRLMLSAIKTREPEKAEAAAINHVRNAGSMALRILKERGVS